MKKRIFAIVMLALMLLPALCLPAFADGRMNEGDITQNTSGVKPDGYEYAFHYIDYDKGVTGDEINRLDAVYIMHVSVFSDYAEQGLAEIPHDSALFPSYTKCLSVGGIPDNAPYNDPNYLGEQLFGGVTIRRDKENELKDFVGQFYFTNDDAYVNWTDDYELYKVWYQVRYNYWADVSFSISNVVFDENGISMDIDGEQSYRYEVISEMHDSYPAGNEVPDSEREAFAEFKAKTDRKKGAEETRRTISVKGAKAEFVLYDLENSNDKNLLLKVEGDGIRLLFNVRGVIGHTGAPVNPGVTQNAETTPGEDGGVFVPGTIVEGVPGVPAAIVIGVLGGGAAIASAAAASGVGSSDDKKKNQKSYKMYVQKDFGDAIRRGGDKPVVIRARMAEVDENGAEHDRNDLTSNIAVSADGMTVHSAALVGRYCEASVSVPMEYDKDTASITFTFTGEGGSFTNTVIFRIVDGPQLKFVDERDGTLYHENCGIDAIPGDGFTYTERFMIVDAPVAPKLSDISAVNTGEFDVEFALTDQPALYKMTVKNNTKPDSEHDIFAKPEDKNFEIHVNVEGEKEPVKGYVTVKLYPEGITVSSTMEGKKNGVKYVRVQAYEKDYVGDLDRKWQVSEIKFTLAHKGKDKAIIDPKEAEYKFEKLKGAGGLGTRADKEESIAEKYEYKESFGDRNGKFTYDFEPNATLCEPGDGTFFMTLLPVTCDYDGQQYEAEIPLRLVGEAFDPMAGWDEDYKKLRGRIEKYALPDNKDDLLKRLADLAEDPRCAVDELRLTSKYVVRQYMTYWTVQSMKHQDEAKVYDVIIDYLEWAKFFGDCAFSFLVNAYAGPVADAILSPTKDFLTEAIGETVARWMRGQKIDFDVYKSSLADNMLGIFDNLVSGNIGFSSWRQAAYSLGAYFAYASVKNFYMTLIEENKFDLYGSLVKGFSDMTAAGLKAAASHLFDAALKKCPGFRAKLSAWCGQFVSKNLGANASLLDLRAADGVTRSQILRKYLDDLFGMAIDKLIEKTGDIHDKYVASETGFAFDENGHLIVQFFFEIADHSYDCKVDVTKALLSGVGGFFDYVFDLIYGDVPVASALISAPSDPPLAPAKE